MTIEAAARADVGSLEARARRIRRHIVQMVARAQSGHPGGSLSATDLLVALYWTQLRHDPANPTDPDRDRFLLSKGHATPVYYAVLAEAGYFPLEDLEGFRQWGSRLQGHPSLTFGPPGVEIQGGSLGHGLAIGAGIALGHRLDGREARTWVMLGDGELQEGEVWETAMAASHYRLGSLVAIVDWNKLQQDGFVADVMPLDPLADKWRAFGWDVREIDGHDMGQILDAYAWASQDTGRPHVILAHTVKGKGVSYMENQGGWHGKGPNPEQLAVALAELADR
jgi:transketolase